MVSTFHLELSRQRPIQNKRSSLYQLQVSHHRNVNCPKSSFCKLYS
jgi:hypothetical protein